MFGVLGVFSILAGVGATAVELNKCISQDADNEAEKQWMTLVSNSKLEERIFKECQDPKNREKMWMRMEEYVSENGKYYQLFPDKWDILKIRGFYSVDKHGKPRNDFFFLKTMTELTLMTYDLIPKGTALLISPYVMKRKGRSKTDIYRNLYQFGLVDWERRDARIPKPEETPEDPNMFIDILVMKYKLSFEGEDESMPSPMDNVSELVFEDIVYTIEDYLKENSIEYIHNQGESEYYVTNQGIKTGQIFTLLGYEKDKIKRDLTEEELLAIENSKKRIFFRYVLDSNSNLVNDLDKSQIEELVFDDGSYTMDDYLTSIGKEFEYEDATKSYYITSYGRRTGEIFIIEG